jgi:hypothetical protein
MKTLPALVGAALAAFVLAGSTAATPTAVTRLKLGDIIEVAGTHIACQATVGTTNLKGKKLIGCLLTTAKGDPALGTYAPALATDGEVVIVKVSKKAPVVYRRTLSAAGPAAKGRAFRAKVGDGFALDGTDLGCAVQKTKGILNISCFKFAASGGKPNTYGFAITDKFVVIVKFDKAHNSRAIYSKAQP